MQSATRVSRIMGVGIFAKLKFFFQKVQTAHEAGKYLKELL